MRYIGIYFFLLVLTSCTSTSTVKSFEETLKEDHVPLKEAIWAREQGDKIHAEIKEKGLIYRNPEAQDYIDGLEKRLLSGQQDYNLAIQVFIFRSPAANAFALPNGVIYINSGLFTTLRSEGQLAAIIAHEIAHVTERHAVKRVISNKNTLIGAHIADIVTGGFGFAYFPAHASIQGFSRENESEADTVGLARLLSAGYDPISMPEVFERFKEIPELKYVENSIYSSHPSQDRRIADLNNQIAANKQMNEGRTYEADNSQFSVIKAQIMESNTRMRLKSRQFNQAASIVNEAKSYYSDSQKLSFYQGEVYFGFYKYPVDAAEEKHWIETGKIYRENKYVELMEAAKEENLSKAEFHYLASVSGDSPFLPGYKRLGEIKKSAGDYPAAINWFSRYIEANPEAPDRRYVERLIERIK